MRDKTDPVNFFFQGLGENTCSLQPALKNTATRPLRPRNFVPYWLLRSGLHLEYNYRL